MREFLFQLPPPGAGNLQTRVRKMLVDTILDGQLPAGAPLPSCRRLAKQLGIARNTVVLAYQHLVDDGFLESRERSGFYVADAVLEGHAVPARVTPANAQGVSTSPHWRSRIQIHATALAVPHKPNDWQNYRYPFVYGQIDPELFPLAEWRECCREALSVRSVREWSSDRVDDDDNELLEQLQTRVLPRRGVWAKREEILVTLGAQQALYLLATLLIGRQHTVGIEEPGYADARNILSLHAGRMRYLDVDAEGLVPDDNVAGCDYLYTTPSHQCPTTVTMPMTRREELLETAARHDVVIIEDDYESETNYQGAPAPALRSLDASGRVLYVGSLSKSLAPGLRLGYLVAPAEIVREARALRRFMLRHPPANNERSVALFLSRGHHDALLRRLAHAFQRRWATLGEALAEHLPDANQIQGLGGTSFWIHGPEGLDANALRIEAQARGVLIERGDIFYGRERHPQNVFRLGFSAIAEDRIRDGVAELAQLIAAARKA